MKNTINENNKIAKINLPIIKKGRNEHGSALVIALLIMALLMVFVVLAISRTTAETQIMANDEAESRTYGAAQAGLEFYSREFDKIIEFGNLNPTPGQLTTIQAKAPDGFADYDYLTSITRSPGVETQILNGERDPLKGLYALRTRWTIDSTVTETSTGVQVQLKRSFFNNAVPIFQFGAFYNDDLINVRPAPLTFNGRIHTNGNFFLFSQQRAEYTSQISAHRNIIMDQSPSGEAAPSDGNNVWVKTPNNGFLQLQLNQGSALRSGGGTDVCNNPTNNVPKDPPLFLPLPPCYTNSNWNTIETAYDGNLKALQARLDLPLRADSYNELIKRRKELNNLYKNLVTGNLEAVTAATVDPANVKGERYANKAGIHVSLADSKAKLPGCITATSATVFTAVTTSCGVRLDANANGDGTSTPSDLGYNPMSFPMTDGYQTTRLNGNRFRTNTTRAWDNDSQEMWIKIELVRINETTGAVETRDITRDILSLGITETAPRVLGSFQFPDSYYYTPNSTNDPTDGRSIVQMQRFVIKGPEIVSNKNAPAASNYFEYLNVGEGYNYVMLNRDANCGNASTDNLGFNNDSNLHKKPVNTLFNSAFATRCIVAFPIEMFDEREGAPHNTPPTITNLPLNGVMSIVQIDVRNLKRFLEGNFDKVMPVINGVKLLSSDVFRSNNGWVLSLSDRRGDKDFDGEYDMEDIYGPNDPTLVNSNDGILSPGEDVNRDKVLQADYNFTDSEAPKYSVTDAPDAVAAIDHRYYRRAFRLINGQRIPGRYNSATPANTLGFSVASENGIYVQGNYNADTTPDCYGGVNAASCFKPLQNSPDDVPASVVGDAVTVLSNAWNDAKSFRQFFVANTTRTATETSYRFAVITGKSMDHLSSPGPNQGGTAAGTHGGLINLIRYLENWNTVRMNYSGSFISLFNARVNNGAFKCCTYSVYLPPNRNFTFDNTFLDPDRLPPGTPAIQYVQFTGYERINN